MELYENAKNLRLYVSESDLRLSMMINNDEILEEPPKEEPEKPHYENLEQSIFIMPKAERDEQKRKEEEVHFKLLCRWH